MPEQFERPALRIEQVGYAHPDAVRLVAVVQAEYVVRYGSPDATPLDPVMFDPPAGAYFLGYLDSGPVVSGGWRRVGDVEVTGTTRVAEVKRMYVAAPARGRGLARLMLAHLEASAAEAGAEAMILETGAAQPEAIALYTSAGYAPIPPFGHYRNSPLSRSFGRRLDRGDGRGARLV